MRRLLLILALLLVCVSMACTPIRRGRGGGGSGGPDLEDDDATMDDDDADDDDAEDDPDDLGGDAQLSIDVRDLDGWLLAWGACSLDGWADATPAWDFEIVACEPVGDPPPEFNQEMDFPSWSGDTRTEPDEDWAGLSLETEDALWSAELDFIELSEDDPDEGDGFSFTAWFVPAETWLLGMPAVVTSSLIYVED